MYDLSWLNPTPHAIAVYASQPLSPVTTQHSLPSRTRTDRYLRRLEAKLEQYSGQLTRAAVELRYPLLGPDSYEAPLVKGGDLAGLVNAIVRH